MFDVFPLSEEVTDCRNLGNGHNRNKVVVLDQNRRILFIARVLQNRPSNGVLIFENRKVVDLHSRTLNGQKIVFYIGRKNATAPGYTNVSVNTFVAGWRVRNQYLGLVQLERIATMRFVFEGDLQSQAPMDAKGAGSLPWLSPGRATNPSESSSAQTSYPPWRLHKPAKSLP
jgi:hypothetical protein